MMSEMPKEIWAYKCSDGLIHADDWKSQVIETTRYVRADKHTAALEALREAMETLEPFASNGYYWVSSKNRNNIDIFIGENEANPLWAFNYRKRTHHNAEQALAAINKVIGDKDE